MNLVHRFEVFRLFSVTIILPIDHDSDGHKTYLGQIRHSKAKSVEVHFEVSVELRDDLVQNEQTEENIRADHKQHHFLLRVVSYENVQNCLNQTRKQKVNLHDSGVSPKTTQKNKS